MSLEGLGQPPPAPKEQPETPAPGVSPSFQTRRSFTSITRARPAYEPTFNPQSLVNFADQGGRGAPEKFFTLEAPPQLTEGQGFYDQPPFNPIVGNASEQSGIPQSNLQVALTQFGRSRDWQELRDMTPQKQVEYARTSGTYTFSYSTFMYTCGLRAAQKQPFQAAATDMIVRLADYPYWMEYIRTQYVSHLYKADGTYHPRQTNDIPPLSYAQWASEQLEADANIKKIAAELVAQQAFPQQFGEKTVDDVARATGEKKGNRRYVILKASELPKR